MKELSRRERKRLKKAARLIIKTVSRTVKVNGNYGDFKSDLWSNGLLDPFSARMECISLNRIASTRKKCH